MLRLKNDPRILSLASVFCRGRRCISALASQSTGPTHLVLDFLDLGSLSKHIWMQDDSEYIYNFNTGMLIVLKMGSKFDLV
jgi:hypothetical protein